MVKKKSIQLILIEPKNEVYTFMSKYHVRTHVNIHSAIYYSVSHFTHERFNSFANSGLPSGESFPRTSLAKQFSTFRLCPRHGYITWLGRDRWTLSLSLACMCTRRGWWYAIRRVDDNIMSKWYDSRIS